METASLLFIWVTVCINSGTCTTCTTPGTYLVIKAGKTITCLLCQPGTKFVDDCPQDQTTATCASCDRGTFESCYNRSPFCARCKLVCPPKFEHVPTCNATHDNTCECQDGLHRKDSYVCLTHTVCQPGEKVQTLGTKYKNTECVPCPNGTYSTTENSSQCQKCRVCTGNQIVKTNCTGTRDAVCIENSGSVHESRDAITYSVIGVVVVLVLTVAGVLICCYIKRRNRNSRELALEMENVSPAVPDRVPDADPDRVPDADPYRVPDADPDRVPDADPDRVPDADPDRVPDAVPDRVPDADPDRVPDADPDRVPDAVPDRVPDADPDRVPDADPDRVPDADPDRVPDAVPDRVPDADPDRVPDADPDRVPDADPDRVPDADPDRVPDAVPDRFSNAVYAKRKDPTPFSGEHSQNSCSTRTQQSDTRILSDVVVNQSYSKGLAPGTSREGATSNDTGPNNDSDKPTEATGDHTGQEVDHLKNSRANQVDQDESVKSRKQEVLRCRADKCTEEMIRWLKDKIPIRKKEFIFSILFGNDDAVEEQEHINPRNIKLQMYTLLYKWRDKLGSDATADKLVNALVEEDCEKVANEFKEKFRLHEN